MHCPGKKPISPWPSLLIARKYFEIYIISDDYIQPNRSKRFDLLKMSADRWKIALICSARIFFNI
ncbi:Uncharacterized protein dnm_070500 [Desulfonema magnum]|uniref:Uncharacterized protein n=1 Tax=Desulfonema magnum TaxID=45655 RepID=A0A975GRF1_9BACT|nr:Uncharacterized protein dnm_070500 [Desulfonema magnum]